MTDAKPQKRRSRKTPEKAQLTRDDWLDAAAGEVAAGGFSIALLPRKHHLGADGGHVHQQRQIANALGIAAQPFVQLAVLVDARFVHLRDQISRVVISAGKIPHRQLHLQATCLFYTSPSPRDLSTSRMPSSA